MCRSSRFRPLLLPALGETLVMVGIVMTIVVLVGVPLGSLIHNLAPGGLFENRVTHTVVSWVISIGRSLPFLILMAAIVPFTRFVTGTNIGIPAAVVPMSLAGIAFFTRIVENSLRSVPLALTRVARSSGASPLQIITHRAAERSCPLDSRRAHHQHDRHDRVLRHRGHHRRGRHRLRRRDLRLRRASTTG